MADNTDWVAQNLQRQRKMLEEKQRQKRAASAGVRSNVTVNNRTPIVDRYGTTVDALLSYDFGTEPEVVTGPVLVNVKGMTPPQTRANEKSSSEEDLMDRMDKADIAACIHSDDEEIRIDPWKDDIDETLAADETPDIEEITQHLDRFVMTPAKKSVHYKCSITRDKRGVDKGMFPTYYLHLERGEDLKKLFLLAARKRKKSATANYLISTDATDLSREGSAFVGKVRCNALGTCFTLYDNGDNPKKIYQNEKIRQELACVLYETNVLGFKGPRKMTVVIPGIYDTESYKWKPVQPIRNKDSLAEKYRKNRMDELVVMSNKSPVWNEDSQSYVLNFHGRVTQASVKNFQIVHLADPEYVVMQFGRISDDHFSMDFRYPLSALQAFGIAMTSFHPKLACE